MAKQNLSAFQSAFGMKPIAIEIKGFEDMPSMLSAFIKDGGTAAELVKEFGDFLGKAYETLAKDGSFYLKPLISSARDEYEASIVGIKGNHNFANIRAKLVSLCWCSSAGDPIGTPKQVGGLRTDMVAAIYDDVRRVNGMEIESTEEAGND